MKNIKNCLLILVFLSIGSVSQAGQLVPLKDFLKKELSSSAKMSKESFPLQDAHKQAVKALAKNADDSEYTFYYGKSADGKIEKACTVVAQQGKEGPMSIGICFDPVGLITNVTILSSEEERGKKVAEESFLKQFRGKKMSDAFQVGKDVDGVSGATWSSNAVSEALRKSSYAFKTFVAEKK